MQIFPSLIALALLPAVLCHPFKLENMGPKNHFSFTEGALRMNQIQVIGTHNSYHREPQTFSLQKAQKRLVGLKQAEKWWYSHPDLSTQLEMQQVRSLELDVYIDELLGVKSGYASSAVHREAGERFPRDGFWARPGFKVFNKADEDMGSNCVLLKECLKQINNWLNAHPDSVPISIMLELKVSSPKYKSVRKYWTEEHLLALENLLIRSFGREKVIVPDDVRNAPEDHDENKPWDRPSYNTTLEGSVTTRGWPDLDSVRGKVFFIMENGQRPDEEQDPRSVYLEERPNLEGRVMFVDAEPGDAACAFQTFNVPEYDNRKNIQKQVENGYMVRARADADLQEVLYNCDATRRGYALQTGAQIVTTDFPTYGSSARFGCDYAVRLPDRKQARCNPVNSPEWCFDTYGMEPEQYWIGGNQDILI